MQNPIAIDRGQLVTGDTGKADGEFHRYDSSAATGVSLRSVPGTKHGQYYANSYEHDGTGHMTDDATKRKQMADKRLRKFTAIVQDILPPVTTGDQDADITFVTWGTTRGPVTAASDLLRAKGKKVSMVSFPWVFPFPVAVTIALLAKAKRVIDVEQNATAQLAQLIHSETGIAITERILKYDGRPLLPEEIAEQAVRSI